MQRTGRILIAAVLLGGLLFPAPPLHATRRTTCACGQHDPGGICCCCRRSNGGDACSVRGTCGPMHTEWTLDGVRRPDVIPGPQGLVVQAVREIGSAPTEKADPPESLRAKPPTPPPRFARS